MNNKKFKFMVHKHKASRLHYDLRLEIETNLKSWALSEISLKPNKEIIAIRVADHPLWYRHFEGVIPEGSYGAGPVMVWDKGLFTNFNTDNKGKYISVEQCLNSGFFLLWFEGHKLNGGYILLRISKKQRWIMVKLNDTFAQLHGRKPKGWNRSVKSNKTLEAIEKK